MTNPITSYRHLFSLVGGTEPFFGSEVFFAPNLWLCVTRTTLDLIYLSLSWTINSTPLVNNA